MKKIVLIILMIPMVLHGQGADGVRDTIQASYKSASRTAVAESGRYSISGSTLKRISSPMGEADVIKYIQILPGIATGAEGSSSIYARGGNGGNNLITLDGVPIYSTSHLLGLTTSFSQYIVQSTDFYIGGFTSEEGNVTSSHLKMSSSDGDLRNTGGEVSVSNLMLGAGVSTPIIKDKLSFIGSIRISPLGLEYRAFRNVINKNQNVFDNLSLSAWDAFAKFKYLIDSKSSVSLSVFGMSDSYSIEKAETSANDFGWTNTFANLNYDRKDFYGFDVNARFSYSYNGSRQSMMKLLGSAYNRLEIRNVINDVLLSADAEKNLGKYKKLKFGVKAKTAVMNPGSSRKYEGYSKWEYTPLSNNTSASLLLTAHGQIEWERPDVYSFRAAARLNAYICKMGVAPALLANPEISLMSKYHVQKNFGFEATLDYLTQYYHTLEGIPLGWSLDMIVPSDRVNRPEHSHQAYLGLFGDMDKHHIRLGAYAKYMQNLVYYPDAKNLFTQGLVGWHENVKTGTGSSYGMEFLYEKTGTILSYKLAYTLSKTDRLFKDLNEGKSFPAKFDRRHIANAQIDYAFVNNENLRMSLSSQFTFQSGHWETLSDGYILAWDVMKDQEIMVPHVSGTNNYKMPDYIRWDNSVCAEFSSRRVSHIVKIGVYNTLNRHNPFMILYDEKTDKWKTLSLIPIMPNIYYCVSF